jgi:hypothetical protein
MICAKCVLLVALLAQASLPSAGAEDKAKAKVLLHEGLDFNRQGEHAQALEKFKAAYAAYPSPKLWFNIGQVQLALDHPVEAIDAFEKFLASVPDAQPEDKRVAKSTVAQLGKKLGRMQIKCETSGAEVAVDGKSIGRVPLPGPVWATLGSHQVTLTYEGSTPATETVEMRAGTTALVVIRLVPISPAAPVPPPSVVTPGPAAPGDVTGATVQTAPANETARAAGQPIATGETIKVQPQSPEPVPTLPVSIAPPPTTPAALDLSVQPNPAEVPSEARPVYKTWWFWTGAAVIVAGAATTIFLLTDKGGSNVPGTPLGNHGVFQ